jgi:hypothetical protein
MKEYEVKETENEEHDVEVRGEETGRWEGGGCREEEVVY